MENLKTIKELLSRTNKKITAHYGKCDHGEYLLDMANLYNIPYNEKEPDWLKLIDNVNKYLYLVELATYYDLSWDYDIYDPIGLNQLIEGYEIDSCVARVRDHHHYYQAKFA